MRSKNGVTPVVLTLYMEVHVHVNGDMKFGWQDADRAEGSMRHPALVEIADHNGRMADAIKEVTQLAARIVTQQTKAHTPSLWSKD